jgi:hypothetical protein
VHVAFHPACGRLDGRGNQRPCQRNSGLFYRPIRIAGLTATSTCCSATVKERSHLGPATLLPGPLTGDDYAPMHGPGHTKALTSIWDLVDGFAFRITLPALLPCALLVGHTGPAALVNTEITAAAPPVVFTSLPVSFTIGPDRGAAPSVAKPIAAFVILHTTALRHVLRPGA